ncbi:MAG TPA: uroporphyrinogen decarboxylase [Acidimicrobiales bacterium]|nr:uroporphyrinogen decarboxylase [Acidimicrobiales bacterium]
MNDDFLRACRREPSDRIPVWFMRQAGRCLPEYRAVRAEHEMFEVMASAELTALVTEQPVKRFGVDAAVIFSDIVAPLAAAGIDVKLVADIGPVFADPVRNASDVAALPRLDDPGQSMRGLLGGIAQVAAGNTVPVIGFCGGPFTLASYLVEGGPSRDYARTKALMLGSPEVWDALMDVLSDIAATSLLAQIDAGASAVQIFDSWVGALDPENYRRFAMPATAAVLARVATRKVPRIVFGVSTGELLSLFAEAGADVVGVDWRVPLDQARARVGPGVAVQGNLDPAVCLAGWPAVEAAARRVLDAAGAAPGHVFNLGWGVMPATDPEVLTQLVDWVHRQPAPVAP